MAWSPQQIVNGLNRKGLLCLAKKHGLDISETLQLKELRNRIGSYFSNNPNKCLSGLRKYDHLRLIFKFSEAKKIHLPDVSNLSKAERLRILKAILLKDEEPKHYGFRDNGAVRDYQIEATDNGFHMLLSQDKPVGIHIGTGGGKTRIGNDIVAKWLYDMGGTVFWISKRWIILKNARKDQFERYPTVKARKYGGEKEEPTVRQLNLDKDFKCIVYSMLLTLHSRKKESTEILSKASL